MSLSVFALWPCELRRTDQTSLRPDLDLPKATEDEEGNTVTGNRGVWRSNIYVYVLGLGEERKGRGQPERKKATEKKTSRNVRVWFAWISKKPRELGFF